MISMPEALVAQVDARDVGKGRSEVIRRLLLRYFGAVHKELRTNPPGPKTISAVQTAVLKGIGDDEAEILTDDSMQRMALLDVAERAVVAQSKKGR